MALLSEAAPLASSVADGVNTNKRIFWSSPRRYGRTIALAHACAVIALTGNELSIHVVSQDQDAFIEMVDKCIRAMGVTSAWFRRFPAWAHVHEENGDGTVVARQLLYPVRTMADGYRGPESSFVGAFNRITVGKSLKGFSSETPPSVVCFDDSAMCPPEFILDALAMPSTKVVVEMGTPGEHDNHFNVAVQGARKCPEFGESVACFVDVFICDECGWIPGTTADKIDSCVHANVPQWLKPGYKEEEESFGSEFYPQPATFTRETDVNPADMKD